MDRDERIRLEEFRQLKNEIRGSKQYLIVGIDIIGESDLSCLWINCHQKVARLSETFHPIFRLIHIEKSSSRDVTIVQNIVSNFEELVDFFGCFLGDFLERVVAGRQYAKCSLLDVSHALEIEISQASNHHLTLLSRQMFG